MPTAEHIRLGMIAGARSGDKGSSANVGVVARSPAAYAFLVEHLSAERVREYFAPLGLKGVVRYELPNLHALNFILEGALAGGGSRSLRTDAQGKALGQALLEMTLEVAPGRMRELLAGASRRAEGPERGAQRF
jgi:hypothetical protein